MSHPNEYHVALHGVGAVPWLVRLGKRSVGSIPVV